ncbi:helix-turn-helix domain-containing protein [Providencia alcalifaciens]|uniref:helix-turn-helix domain-containing protein n=2 Tax=Pseudomonadota TaxID=1224 RepID=UPI003D81A958
MGYLGYSVFITQAIAPHKTGQNRTKQDKTGQDRTRQDKTGRQWTRKTKSVRIITIFLKKSEHMHDEILTLKQVADYLKVNEKTVYRLIASKKIPCFKVGHSWRFKKEDLELWIQESIKK